MRELEPLGIKAVASGAPQHHLLLGKYAFEGAMTKRHELQAEFGAGELVARAACAREQTSAPPASTTMWRLLRFSSQVGINQKRNHIMKQTHSNLIIATLAMAGALAAASPVMAQVAGTATSVTESTKEAMGWSVKKTLMGKNVYNDADVKVGKVEDLIVSPEKNVSYVIVGAGGFVGINRHDVAIPVSQIQNNAGKLVLSGATKASIKAMPEFVYKD